MKCFRCGTKMDRVAKSVWECPSRGCDVLSVFPDPLDQESMMWRGINGRNKRLPPKGTLAVRGKEEEAE